MPTLKKGQYNFLPWKKILRIMRRPPFLYLKKKKPFLFHYICRLSHSHPYRNYFDSSSYLLSLGFPHFRINFPVIYLFYSNNPPPPRKTPRKYNAVICHEKRNWVRQATAHHAFIMTPQNGRFVIFQQNFLTN